MEKKQQLVYKFNPNSKAEFYKISKRKPYKLLTMLCTGKADDISDVDKLWLIKQMERQLYFPHDSVCVLGWRLYFKPYIAYLDKIHSLLFMELIESQLKHILKSL